MWDIHHYYRLVNGRKTVSHVLFNDFNKLAYQEGVNIDKFHPIYKNSVIQYTKLIDKYKEENLSKFTDEEKIIILKVLQKNILIKSEYELILPWHFTLWLIFTNPAPFGTPGERILLTIEADSAHAQGVSLKGTNYQVTFV